MAQSVSEEIIADSERKQESNEHLHAAETLLESENRFRNLSEDALVGIYIIQDSFFRYVNPKMAEIFGYAVEEIVDKLSPRLLVLDEDWPTVRDNLQKRLSDEQRSIHYEFRGVRKDKEIVIIEVFGSRTMILGKPAVIGTLLDITERKSGELEILRLNAELGQKIAELIETQEELIRKEKLAILGQLSGSIGHELRTPLGIMSNAIYFLKMQLTDADETTREYLDIIKHEIDVSLRIITDLLGFTRTSTPCKQPLPAAQ
ncbi:MAG: PAS domain S-box protein, partial [Desulfuromonadales bacterium]|nr:PAS domain S-box protein [Desulfuromonadales bacterium]